MMIHPWWNHFFNMNETQLRLMDEWKSWRETEKKNATSLPNTVVETDSVKAHLNFAMIKVALTAAVTIVFYYGLFKSDDGTKASPSLQLCEIPTHWFTVKSLTDEWWGNAWSPDKRICRGAAAQPGSSMTKTSGFTRSNTWDVSGQRDLDSTYKSHSAAAGECEPKTLYQ